jgi:O-antigen/teichoic acid export membrane protein
VTAVAPASAEVRRSARSGAIGLLGAAVNGAAGFVLTAVVVRTLGAGGSGAYFALVGLVSILGPVCCLGADTGLMWALPRRTAGPGGDAVRLLPLAVLPTTALAGLVAVVGWFAAGAIAPALLDGGDADRTLIRLAFVGVPVFTATTVLMATVRASRPVSAYVSVQLVAVPILRPVLIGVAVALGGGVFLGFAGWLLPLAAAAVVALLLVVRPLGLRAGARLRPDAADRRVFWGFALPRAVSTAIDSGSMWVGVLLTTALASQTQAGVFGAVGRYVLAGLLIMQGLRVAIAPQLSRLLGQGRHTEAAQIYRRTTLWIVLLSWPAYLLLAVFAPAFLAVFGEQFAAGAAPMAVLAVAMLVNVGVGLVQTLLLMSGHSRRHLIATVAGLTLNVVGCVVLIPPYGALGAAIAWSLGIVCENVLAAVFARRALGQPLFSRGLLVAGAGTVAITGTASAVGVLAAGRGVPGLAVALGVLAAGCLAALGSGRVRSALMDVRRQLQRESKP